MIETYKLIKRAQTSKSLRQLRSLKDASVLRLTALTLKDAAELSLLN